MFEWFTLLLYIGAFLLCLLIAFPLAAVGMWAYERITGKDVLDCDDFEA